MKVDQNGFFSGTTCLYFTTPLYLVRESTMTEVN